MSATVFYNHATELATLTNTFSVAGTPTDPTTISLTVTDPADTATTYTYAGAQITRTGTGIYTKDVSCTAAAAGIWTAVWVGTGTAADVTTVTWTTVDTNPRLYCSVEELKSRLRITGSSDDFEVRLAVESVSREIDTICERQFWRGTATRTFAAAGPYEVAVDDLVSVTTLATDAAGDGTYETTWAGTDYQLLPTPAAAPETRPYTRIKAIAANTFPYTSGWPARDDRVQVTGVFGWPAVPAAVKQACLVMAAEMLKLKDAPFGVAGYGEFGPIRVRHNPMAMTLLAPYRRYPMLVA